MRRSAVTAIVVLVVAALIGVACSDDDDGDGSSPRPTDTPVTEAIDYSGVALQDVAGRTTTTALAEVGTASIVGSVAGPGGLLVGATVRVEHLVAGGEVRTDVLTGPDGRFELRNVPGGRYRVRAFLAPAYALVTPDVRFLDDAKEHVFDLVVEDQRRLVARATVAPDPPALSDAVNLVAVVASRAVDLDGVVRSTPVIGVRVELSGLGRWTLRGAPTGGRPLISSTTSTTVRARGDVAFTDATGQVRFDLQCDIPGPPGLSLLVPVTVAAETIPGQPPSSPTTRLEPVALELPECIDPNAVPDTTADTTDTTDDTDADPEDE